MGSHPLHEAIGRLFDQRALPGVEIRKDTACQPTKRKRITLSLGAGADRAQVCFVDLIAVKPGKSMVIIEIEESNVKPVQIFGKFLASALSTHQGESRIDRLPLLFIQVVDTSALKLGKSKKGYQWSSVKAAIKEHARKWPDRRIVYYELLEGRPTEFEPGSEQADRLVKMVQAFLGVRG